ncbi:MAG: hypothetical protein KDA85_19840 [Planctomycetaceae bacterium]|nr:hypothetical protein [Planctomycetaceae bacterium]
MKFSVVGSAVSAVQLFRDLTDAGWVAGPLVLNGELRAAVAETGVPLTLAAAAEDVFTTGDVDCIVVAVEDVDESLSLIRNLLQAERHVIVLPPEKASAAYAHELHLLLDEYHHAVIPVIGRLWLADLPAGQCRLTGETAETVQIQCEAETSPGPSLDELQARLVDAVCAVGGPWSQVTVIETAAPDGTVLARMLTLGTSQKSTLPTPVVPPATIQIRTVRSGDRMSPVLTKQSADGTSCTMSFRPQCAVAATAAELCESPARCVEWMTAFATTYEIKDAAVRSIAKRRTIDIHFDSGGERSVFKGQMAVMGCGVLLLTLLAFIVLSMIDHAVNMPTVVRRIVEFCLLTPLVVFSLLQFLLPLARTPSRSGLSSAASDDEVQ